MVDSTVSRITKYSGNRHSLYLRSDLVQDSAFPFEADEQVVVKIEEGRLVVEPASETKEE